MWKHTLNDANCSSLNSFPTRARALKSGARAPGVYPTIVAIVFKMVSQNYQTLRFLESKALSEAKIQQLFEKYKDETEDAILSEGVEQLCIDLQLKPDEFRVLGRRSG